MRAAILPIALAGVVAANPAPAPEPTAAAVLEARACNIDYDLGRPIQPPASVKAWLRTARPPNDCTDVMPASITAGWMSYLGQLSSFVAHAPEKASLLTDLCGQATSTVSINFCSTQGKIIVTDEDNGSTLSTITNTVRDPGAVILTSKDGKIGVASADATPTATGDDSESTGAGSSAATKTGSETASQTTGAGATTGGASQTTSGAASTRTDKPKGNGAEKLGAGVAAVAAVAALVL